MWQPWRPPRRGLWRSLPSPLRSRRRCALARDILEIPYQEIAEQVKVIHNKIKFKEAPLYLPEIVMSYPEIQIIQIEKEQTHKDPVLPVMSSPYREDAME